MKFFYMYKNVLIFFFKYEDSFVKFHKIIIIITSGFKT